MAIFTEIILANARILLGFVFVLLGLNIFLHFFYKPPPPTALAGGFVEALFVSH